MYSPASLEAMKDIVIIIVNPSYSFFYESTIEEMFVIIYMSYSYTIVTVLNFAFL